MAGSSKFGIVPSRVTCRLLRAPCWLASLAASEIDIGDAARFFDVEKILGVRSSSDLLASCDAATSDLGRSNLVSNLATDLKTPPDSCNACCCFWSYQIGIQS